jgi:hypothetical protein
MVKVTRILIIILFVAGLLFISTCAKPAKLTLTNSDPLIFHLNGSGNIGFITVYKQTGGPPEKVWEIKTKAGVVKTTRLKKLIFGKTPPGFVQEFPKALLAPQLANGNYRISVQQVKEIGPELNFTITDSREKLPADDYLLYGQNRLMLAAESGNLAEVERLLTENLDINAVDNFSQSALMLAASRGHFEVVKTLVAKGASVKNWDEWGWSALMHGVVAGNFKIVKFLHDQGSELVLYDSIGHTPVFYAAIYEYKDILEYLLDNGAHLRQPDRPTEATPPLLAKDLRP